MYIRIKRKLGAAIRRSRFLFFFFVSSIDRSLGLGREGEMTDDRRGDRRPGERARSLSWQRGWAGYHHRDFLLLDSGQLRLERRVRQRSIDREGDQFVGELRWRATIDEKRETNGPPGSRTGTNHSLAFFLNSVMMTEADASDRTILLFFSSSLLLDYC